MHSVPEIFFLRFPEAHVELPSAQVLQACSDAVKTQPVQA